MTNRQGEDRETTPFSGVSDAGLRVVQITDTHLYAQPEGRLLGLKTQDTFEEVLLRVISTMDDLDLVLATGDLVHDGSEAGYQRARDGFQRLGKPVYCIPGNHDNPAVMARVMNSGSVKVVPRATHGNWAFVFLDSTVEAHEGGHLRRTQLDLLQEQLAISVGQHVLICLHHQPVPVGSSWMDQMAVDNAEDFFAIIDRYPQVRAVVWGHVHQAFDRMRKGVRLLASPSTCIQFAPDGDHFGVDPQPPAYRWLVLHPNGRIDTGIERLDALPAGLDVDSAGY
jgi:Icc protein